MQTQIEVKDSKILVTGPYSETNNKKWRELGGKFQSGSWELPDNDTSRAIVAELFGAKSEEVEVIIPADSLFDGSIVQIGGYVLAQRKGRDYRVQMPDGVSLASGSFKASGGSMKNPRVALDSETSFRLCCRKYFAEAQGLEIAPPVSEKPSAIEV